MPQLVPVDGCYKSDSYSDQEDGNKSKKRRRNRSALRESTDSKDEEEVELEEDDEDDLTIPEIMQCLRGIMKMLTAGMAIWGVRMLEWEKVLHARVAQAPCTSKQSHLLHSYWA